MGATKTEIYTEGQNELAAFAKALGHPARIAILQHLLKVNACIGMEIVEEIALAQPTISRHLKELKDAGLICGNVEGNRISYCINEERWHKVQQQLNKLFDTLKGNQDCC